VGGAMWSVVILLSPHDSLSKITQVQTFERVGLVLGTMKYRQHGDMKGGEIVFFQLVAVFLYLVTWLHCI